MKILLVHNSYGSAAPSGENLAVELERDLLSRSGHEVRTFVRHSDELRRQSREAVARASGTDRVDFLGQFARRPPRMVTPSVQPLEAYLVALDHRWAREGGPP